MNKKYIYAAISFVLIVGAALIYQQELAYRSNPYGAKEIDPKDHELIESMNKAVGIPTDEEILNNIISNNPSKTQPLPKEEAIRSAKELMLQKYPDPLDDSQTSWKFDRAEEAVNKWEIHFINKRNSQRAAVIFGKFGEAEIFFINSR